MPLFNYCVDHERTRLRPLTGSKSLHSNWTPSDGRREGTDTAFSPLRLCLLPCSPPLLRLTLSNSKDNIVCSLFAPANLKVFCALKGGLSSCKRRPFGMQNTAYWKHAGRQAVARLPPRAVRIAAGACRAGCLDAWLRRSLRGMRTAVRNGLNCIKTAIKWKDRRHVWNFFAKFARNKFSSNICHHLLQIKL